MTSITFGIVVVAVENVALWGVSILVPYIEMIATISLKNIYAF